MTIRIAGITGESVVDGPGLRCVVFAQGCPHRCRGCHNPQTWDPAGGREITPEEVIAIVKANPLLQGVTLTGGDPFMQAGAMAEVAMLIKEMGKDVITYTGYTWDELQVLAAKDGGVKSLLHNTDILVDGPFIQELKDLGLVFRGSSNQRVIDVKASLEKNAVVLVDW